MKIFITSENNQQIFNGVNLKGAIEAFSVDLSQWCEELGEDITGSEWSTVVGNATVDDSGLIIGNVLTGFINCVDAGSNLLKCIVSTASAKYVVLINYLVRDPNVATGDYKIV